MKHLYLSKKAPMMKPSLRQNVLLFIASALVSILILEVLVRFIKPADHQISMVRIKEDLIDNVDNSMWRNKPNFRGRFIQPEFNIEIRTNSQGLRDHEYSPEKASDTFRILTLGDSFTFGYGVETEETYAKVLEKLLNRRAELKYEVLNGGVIGYNTFHELRYLKESGLALHPDLVVIGFTAGTYMGGPSGSDLFANLHHREVFETPSSPGAGDRLKFWLVRHSHLYHFVQARFWNWSASKTYAESANDGAADAARYADDLAQAWSITKDIFKDMRDLAAPQGARMSITFIPIYSNILSKEPDVGNTLSEVGSELGLSVCNPFPILLDLTQKGHRLYLLEDDGHHWNAYGHRVVAEVIYNCLISQGLAATGATKSAAGSQ